MKVPDALRNLYLFHEIKGVMKWNLLKSHRSRKRTVAQLHRCEGSFFTLVTQAPVGQTWEGAGPVSKVERQGKSQGVGSFSQLDNSSN
jgi:hypothetical protein